MMYLRADPPAPDVATATVDGVATVAGLVAPYRRPFSRYGETFAFDTLEVPEPLATVKLLEEHDPERPIGYATHADNAAGGLTMAFAVPDLPPGADALERLRHALRDGFSVGVEVSDEATDANGVIRLAGTVREVSLVTVPTFNEARATVNASAATALLTTAATQGETAMPDALPTLKDAEGSFSVTDTPEYAELAARVADLEAGHGSDGHPLARFDGLADMMRASVAADAAGRLTLALTDNLLDGTQNEGLARPGWLSEIFGIIRRRRVAVEAFGGAVALPDTGMTVEWPYLDPATDGLVGEQATQKTDITSAAVDIMRASAPVKTYAGGNDNALQLIERSTPSFLEAYGRIMLGAYAGVTDAAFAAAVFAAGTPLAGAVPPASPADFKAWLFEASDAVDDATGAPASFCLVSPDVFRVLGAMENLESPEYGTSNVPGTASAASLRINVSGLPVLKCRGLAAGSILASNTEAAKFGEDGPSFIDQLNVAKLGRDTAVYGYGAHMVHIPAGVIKAEAAAPRAGKK